jgi:hypothetical protein
VALRRAALVFSVLNLAAACAPSGPASISSFSPTTGPVGITITVFGANLSDVRTATVGGVNAPVLDVTGSRVVIKVPDAAVTGQVTLTSAGDTATSRLRFTVTTSGAITEPSPGPPAVATGTGYSLVSVPTSRGTFVVHLIKEKLTEVTVKTVTANASVCRSDCPVKPLAQYVAENNAYAGLNGTYLCPPDYAECAVKIN